MGDGMICEPLYCPRCGEETCKPMCEGWPEEVTDGEAFNYCHLCGIELRIGTVGQLCGECGR